MMIEREHYFDHDADIGIIGYGNSLEACFGDAARAMFALMGDLAHVGRSEAITIEFEEADVELALVTWLNLLLAKAEADHLILSCFRISKDHHHWHGKAEGELWRDDMERGIDVKGATLTMLSVTEEVGEWEARCVVDV